MNKKIFISIALLTISFSAVYFINYSNHPNSQNINQSLLSNSPKSSISADPTLKEVSYKIEVFAKDLFVPWSIIFTSKDRMLITERNGYLKEIKNGIVNTTPLATFPEVSTVSEEGLMGLASDPDYQENKYLYVCLAYTKNNKTIDRVQRLIDQGDKITKDKVLIDDIPAAKFHAGCRIKFGPDQKLYITTGDATNKQQAQDKSSLAGKILRINNDGSFPADNPFANSPIYSFGHRNPQGIAWQPTTNTLFETEHGPSGNDGPGGGDEINIIQKGQNYGWPIVSHDRSQEGMISPKLVFTPAVAPASAMFYKSDKIPEFTNNFFFGLLKGEGIIRVILDKNKPDQVVSYQNIENINFGRIREVTEGPDGAIYFSTSNRDGRGKIQQNDDKIYRLIAK